MTPNPAVQGRLMFMLRDRKKFLRFPALSFPRNFVCQG